MTRRCLYAGTRGEQMTTLTDQTVREIALENPDTVRIFESLGIDYCCGGRRPLSEACAAAGIDVSRVRQLLSETRPVDGTANWAERSNRDLMAHIVETHHAFVRNEIPRI